MGKQPLYPHVPKSRREALPQPQDKAWWQDVLRKVDDRISDEDGAYLDYKAMAQLAANSGLSVFVRDLQSIADQEFSHAQTLKRIREEIFTILKS